MPLESTTLGQGQAPTIGPINTVLDQPFPFVDLPFDVRLMLYHEWLTAPSNIAISSRRLHDNPNKGPGCETVGPVRQGPLELIGHTGGHWPPRCFNANIIFTCKWMYNEATPIVYSQNRFYFSRGYCFHTFVDFADRLSPDLLIQIQNLRLAFPPLLGQRVALYDSLDALRKLERLESLHLYSLDAWWSSDLDVLRMIDRSRGSAKVLLDVCASELCWPVNTEHGEESEIIAEVESWGWQFTFS